MTDSKQASYKGRNTFHRMNYLYQAATACAMGVAGTQSMATQYGQNVIRVGKKSVQRLEPAMKRTLCKGCHSVLVPGVSARVRLKKRPAQRVVWTCLRCHYSKRFNMRDGHHMWSEDSQAVVETIVRDSVVKRDDSISKEEDVQLDVPADSMKTVKCDSVK